MPETTVTIQTFGQLLKVKRGAETQRAVAQRVGVKHTAICRFERDQRVPTSAHLVKLADALAFTPEDWTLVRQLLGEK